jgi:hypothetical protein
MNLANEVSNVTDEISTLQQKLKSIMNNDRHSVARMPFAIQQYPCGQFSIGAKSGVITYSSESNTYFDSAVFAAVQVAQECSEFISCIDVPEDELYTFIKNSIHGLGFTTPLKVPNFRVRDDSISEKTSGNHDYIADSVNFVTKECEFRDVFDLVNACNIFKCFTLLMDRDRPFMKNLLNDDNIRHQSAIVYQKDQVSSILKKFLKIAEMTDDEIFA